MYYSDSQYKATHSNAAIESILTLDATSSLAWISSSAQSYDAARHNIETVFSAFE